MPYSAEVSRTNPSCFVFLLDQSGSMVDHFPSEDSPKRKADRLAEIINRCLQNIVLRCAKDGDVREYFYVSVVGYGAKVGPALGGILSGRNLVSIKEIGDSPVRIEEKPKKVDDGAGGIIEQMVRFPVWFDPIANGGTPMCNAFALTEEILQAFINEHPNCFPPVVMNITDGEATDGDPTPFMQRVSQLSSTDGNVILFNIHVSSIEGPAIEYPSSLENPPDQFAKLLFDGSGVLPDVMRAFARQEHDHELPLGARAFVFQGEPYMIIKALDIGTRASNLR